MKEGSPDVRRPFTGLAGKLAAGLVVGSLAFFILFGYARLRLEQRHLEGLVRLSADRIGDIIRSSAWQHMMANDRAGLYELIRNIGKEPGIRRLRLMNENGLIRHSTDAAEMGKAVDRTAEACTGCHATGAPLIKLSRKDRTRIFAGPDGHRILAAILPIENHPDCSSAACHAHPASRRVLGVIDVQLTLDEVDDRMEEYRAQTALFLVGGALLMCLFAVLFVWRVLHRPLKELAKGTRRVAAGDLTYRIPVDSRDEVGQLADSFNDMTAKLDRAQAELQEWARTLEERVDEKTEALERAHRSLLRSEKMASLGRLAATVAHEVNNPLFGMLTYARLIRKDVSKVALDEKTRARVEEQLAIIERESMRCGDLMKSLLQFSRQAPIQPSPCPINTVVQRACALIRHQMELAEIELKLHLDPDLGEIIADGGQIQQILIALLVNATEAIGQKGVITVTTRRHGAGVAIAVSDDGPGVDAALQAQIFEPFFTTKENHHRTGLGLAVAKDIVERHGGTIRLQSQAGQGAEFVVELPPAPLPGPGAPSFHRLEPECPKASS